jgi:ACS family D-galactonate transporter-like MFS transporter
MYFIAYVDRVNIGAAAPALRAELRLSATRLGLIFSAFAYSYAAMQIAGGWLADRFGPRIMLTALSATWAVATTLTGASWNITSLVGFRLLVGLSEGGAFPAATRAFAAWMPPTERAFAQGITHGFARLGGALTPPLVLAIVAAHSWRASFVVLGLGSVCWTALWLVIFRDSPITHPWVSAAEVAEIAGDRAPALQVAESVTPWTEIVSKMWLVTLVDFCYGWSLWVFLTWLPSYFSEGRGLPMGKVAIASAVSLMAGVIGDILGGTLSDTIYRRTGSLRFARCGLLILGLCGGLAFLPAAAFTATATAAVGYLAIAFFFLELTNAVLWTLPLDIAGPYAGTASGIMNTGFSLAGIVSPLAFGLLIDRTGRYEWPLLASAAILLVGIAGAIFIDPTRTVHVMQSATVIEKAVR